MSRPPRALLDTSVVIEPPTDLERYADTTSISTLTLAELAYGLHTPDAVVAAARQLRYEAIAALFEPIPYSATAARLYGALCAAVRDTGRNPRPRHLDLLIASVAADEGIPLLTRNPADFTGIHQAVRVIAVDPAP